LAAEAVLDMDSRVPLWFGCRAAANYDLELTLIDHISIPVADLDRAAAFYDAALATLGLHRRKERSGAIGYGDDNRAAPVFWILDRAREGSANAGTGLHVSFEASDRSSVDAFHATAVRCGGQDAGASGLRPQYTMPFYGAFVLDLDGFKLEAVCRAPE
jgi:catechol 2,3-dioxygenase-like lactoylglutathione lyase family enzyme